MSLYKTVLFTCCYSICLFAAMTQSVNAHDQIAAPTAVSNEALYRSTAMPERILLGWKGDTSTSQAVTWRTDTTVKKCYGQIAVAEDGPLFVAKAKAAQIEGTTTPFETNLGPRNYHCGELHRLEAGYAVCLPSWRSHQLECLDALSYG